VHGKAARVLSSSAILLALSLVLVLVILALPTSPSQSDAPSNAAVKEITVKEITPSEPTESDSTEQLPDDSSPVAILDSEIVPVTEIEEGTIAPDLKPSSGPWIEPGTPEIYTSMYYLQGYVPTEIRKDGTQVYEYIPYRVRQPDGTFKEQYSTLTIKPTDSLSMRDEPGADAQEKKEQ